MKNLIKLTFALLITILYQSAYAQSQIAADLDVTIEKHLKESGIAGIAAAVFVDKKLVWSKGYGFSDITKKTPFTTNTLMGIASISKTFTGVCMMKAVEENLLSLDEDINAYLPFTIINPYFPNEKITLRSIATHTSGLADREPFYSDSTYYYGSDSPEVLGEFLKEYYVPGGKYYSKENFYNAKPGEYWEYSNIAAGLAGYIIELRTGMKLSEYSKRHILTPLKMNNTGWFLSEIDVNKHAKLYEKKGESLVPVELYSVTTYPDGGVRTSVAELSSFYLALLNNGEYDGVRILKKESVAELMRFQFSSSRKPANIELNEKNEGLFWRTKMNVTRIGHGGNDYGIQTLMLSDLSKEVAVILFANTSGEDRKLGQGYFSIQETLFKYGLGLKQNVKTQKKN